MVTHLTAHQFDDSYAERPDVVGDRDIATLIPAAVAEVLDTAATWLGWDGRPIHRDGNAWTPHKALRRVADHLLDHLAEIECRVAGRPTLPDRWHGRMVTTHADLAWFTEADLDEATSRARQPGSTPPRQPPRRGDLDHSGGRPSRQPRHRLRGNGRPPARGLTMHADLRRAARVRP